MKPYSSEFDLFRSIIILWVHALLPVRSADTLTEIGMDFHSRRQCAYFYGAGFCKNPEEYLS